MKSLFWILILIPGLAALLISCFEKATDPSDLRDELKPKGSISGLVRDVGTLEGLIGVDVTTDSAGFSTTTDSLGKYNIPNVSEGEYALTFTCSRYFLCLCCCGFPCPGHPAFEYGLS